MGIYAWAGISKTMRPDCTVVFVKSSMMSIAELATPQKFRLASGIYTTCQAERKRLPS